MPAYLFHIELSPLTEELVATIPFHRAYVDRMFAEGRILSYSVSLNRDMIWCVVNAEDEQEAMEKVVAFPLHRFFMDVTCVPLLFHNTVPSSLPGIVLN